MHHRVPPERFRLIAGADKLVNYKFGTGIASHYFCKSCGIHTFTHPRSAPELFTVNVRTLDDFDLALAAPAVFEFDGRHTLANGGGERQGLADPPHDHDVLNGPSTRR